MEEKNNLVQRVLASPEFTGEVPGDVSEMEIIKTCLIGGSQQIAPEGQDMDEEVVALVGSKRVIPPPINLELLASCPEVSSRLGRCIRTYARNAYGGFGWDVLPRTPINDATPEEEKKRIVEQTKRLRRLFTRPNPCMSFTKVLELKGTDKETLGNGYIEIVRNLGGEITGFYHIPGRTVRILQGGEGFVQVWEGKSKFFKNFRDPDVMNAETGERGQELPIGQRATELYHFKIESVRSSWYGIPRYYPCIPAIAGNRYTAMRNVSFFSNDATPRIMLVVSGGQLVKESVADMREFFELRGKGPENAHRVCILQAEPRRAGGIEKAKVTIDVIKLTVGVEDEASFQKYQDANNEEVREVFGIAKIFLSPSGSNRSNAAIERKITNEQEFEPARVDLEYIFNSFICPDILGGGLYEDPIPDDEMLVRFHLKRPEFTFPTEQAEIYRKYATSGVLTPNEIRQSLGFPPFPDKYAFANKPLNIAITEMQISPAMAKAGLRPLVGEPSGNAPTPGAQEQEDIEESIPFMPLDSSDYEELEALKQHLEALHGCEVELRFRKI